MNGTGVHVYDFMSWLNQIVGAVDESGDGWHQYVVPSEDKLNQAFDMLDDGYEKYDAILVDEGQDFRELWWYIIEAALTSVEHGILYIFL